MNMSNREANRVITLGQFSEFQQLDNFMARWNRNSDPHVQGGAAVVDHLSDLDGPLPDFRAPNLGWGS